MGSTDSKPETPSNPSSAPSGPSDHPAAPTEESPVPLDCKQDTSLVSGTGKEVKKVSKTNPTTAMAEQEALYERRRIETQEMLREAEESLY